MLFHIFVEKRPNNEGTNKVSPSLELQFLVGSEKNKEELSFQLTKLGEKAHQLNDKKLKPFPC